MYNPPVRLQVRVERIVARDFLADREQGAAVDEHALTARSTVSNCNASVTAFDDQFQLARPDVRAAFAKLGAQIETSTAEKFKTFFEQEAMTWSELVRATGVKLQ